MVEDRQFRSAWQTVNEVSGRKRILWQNLKAVHEEEKSQKSKEHFKNLLGNPMKITDKATSARHQTKQFMEVELAVLKKIEDAENLQTSMKFPRNMEDQKIWQDIFFPIRDAVYKQNTN